MATQSTPAAEPQGSFGGDLVGMFNFYIDPQASAKLITHKLFWIGPVIVVAIVMLVTGVMSMPVVERVLTNLPPPPNVPPDQFQRQMEIGLIVQKVIVYLSPIVLIIMDAIFAGILMGSSAVAQVKTRFLWLFNLMAGLGLISMLEFIARTAVIHLKTDISTLAELQPPLGLDIFIPEGANRFLTAFVGFFSVFQIWSLVMMVLIYSAAFKVSKGKALGVISPLIILGLLFKLLSAMGQR